MIINPWHDIKPGALAPTRVNAIIEISQGSKAKYEIDKETGLLSLDRILFSDLGYPANYGFVPQTYCDDGDPIDILVMCTQNLEPHCLTEVTVLGAIKMIDNGEHDDKIIGIVSNDPYLQHLKTLEDIPKQDLDTMLLFFETYKKNIKVQGVLHQSEAYNLITKSIQDYINKFGSK